MNSIRENYDQIRALVPPHVSLIAVSKTQSPGKIQTLYNLGHRVFGENKALELRDKYDTLPKDIDWHMIGHLQSNKMKYIANFITLIHSVDNAKLLREINKQALKNNRIIDCLFQIHIAKEEHKFGFTIDELTYLIASDDYNSLKNIRAIGLMGMATYTEDQSIIRSEFKSLKSAFDKIKQQFFSQEEHFKEISMGMSGDFQLAIEEGSTMVRVGSSIFGARN